VLALGLTLLAAAALGGAIVRPAVADFLAEGAAGVAEIARALAWDPASPTLQLALGDALLDAGDYPRARQHLETARRLRPTDAYAPLHLALLADREGDRPRARQALDEALRLDPHDVTLRWEAALLHVLWGEHEPALAHLRYVLAVDPRQRDAAFQLARQLLGPGDDPGTLLPDDAETLTHVLMAALRHGDPALARVAWTKRVRLGPRLAEVTARQYLDALLAAGDGAMALRVWQTLAPPDGQIGGNRVWNGGFETGRLLGWGLDWHLRRVWGVDVALDRVSAAAGAHSLRLRFNSFPTLDFGGVWQPVAVEPGREYRLRALARVTDFVTRSGVKLQVVVPGATERVLAETPPIAGTTDGWVPLEARVSVPPGASLVLLRLRRERAPLPEGNLGGKVWIDEVRLE
jgi:tetratricopeptide (TPR) repeat protein